MSKCHPVYLSKARENRADGRKEGVEVLSGQLVRTCQPEGETAGKKSAGFCKRSGFIQKEKPV